MVSLSLQAYGRMRAITLLARSLARDCDAVRVQKTRQGVCGFRRHEATEKPNIFCHAVLLTARHGYNEEGDIVTKATLQVRKQQLVRGAIYEAAIELFGKKGFDQTTVEEVAQAAGVSRRSFFRY